MRTLPETCSTEVHTMPGHILLVSLEPSGYSMMCFVFIIQHLILVKNTPWCNCAYRQQVALQAHMLRTHSSWPCYCRDGKVERVQTAGGEIMCRGKRIASHACLKPTREKKEKRNMTGKIYVFSVHPWSFHLPF